MSTNHARNMIKTQLETNNVLDARITQAIASVARENFAPTAFKNAAYADASIPVSSTRSITEPLTFARMLDIASIQEDETILLIGDASGYSAAVIAQLAKNVQVLEEEETLAHTITSNVAGYKNVKVTWGSWKEKPVQKSKFDVIFIDGGAEQIPAWIGGLLVDGGRLIYVESKAARPDSNSGLGIITKLVKNDTLLEKTSYADAFVQRLLSFCKASSFIF